MSFCGKNFLGFGLHIHFLYLVLLKFLCRHRFSWCCLIVSGKSFLIKIAIDWFAELVVCWLDGSRLICKFIGKGFLPCVVSFAIMDFVVLP